MNKPLMLKVVNPLVGLAFVLLVGGAIGYKAGLIGYSHFTRVHPIVGFIFAALIILHIILNWGWIKMNFLPKKH
jgi:hypothetical protein